MSTHLNFLGTLPYKNVMQTNEICQHNIFFALWAGLQDLRNQPIILLFYIFTRYLGVRLCLSVDLHMSVVFCLQEFEMTVMYLKLMEVSFCIICFSELELCSFECLKKVFIKIKNEFSQLSNNLSLGTYKQSVDQITQDREEEHKEVSRLCL